MREGHKPMQQTHLYMRFSFLVFLLIFMTGSLSGQTSFFKAKVVSKDSRLHKLKFFAYNSQNDLVLHNTSVSKEAESNWESFGKIDGRIVQQKISNPTSWLVELEQAHLYIRPVVEKYAMQYSWALEMPGDTLLVKFSPITRDASQDEFFASIHRRHQIAGDPEAGLENSEGVEEIMNLEQIKPKALDLRINELNFIADYSAICQLAVAFISVLEIRKRGIQRR